MASNNIILAVPSANSSVNYELPQSESAKLSFSPEDIDGIKLDGQGGLVISFTEGGQVTLSNFQSFIDNGNTLSLADGTNVDPKLLFNALGGQNDNVSPADDTIHIEIPSANAQNEINLEPGQKYLMNFDLSETTGATVKDGAMVIGFANGGKITIANYEQAMASKDAPELSLASKTCVVTGDELITNIQKLAEAGTIESTVLAEEEKEEETKVKSKIAAADMDGQDDIGPSDATAEKYKAEHTKGEGEADDAQKVANVEPAAGEEADIARQLAAIETAAGPGAGGAGRAGGYGYGSRASLDPFLTNPDIGPINPTLLRYRAPLLEPSPFLINNDDNPIAIAPGAKFVDETNLENGPLVVSGSISIDYGSDGPGGVSANGNFNSGGSQTGGQLSSNGVPIEVKVVGNDYVGTANGVVVFTLTVDPADGDYTYTQYHAIDHANGSDPNDQIVLDFGVTAKDGDGDKVSTTIQIVVADDAPEISGAEETVDETNLGPIVETGTLVHDFNEDGPGHIEMTGSFASSGSQLNGALSSSGVPVSVTSTATGYEGKAGNVVVFTLTINPATGEYTYTQFKNLDHADANNPNDIITLTFGAKIIDYDGDTATAPIVINIKDDAPIFQPPCEEGCDPDNGGPQPDKGLEIVDETNLKGGPAIETGKLDADFGSDVPGSYAFKSDSFTSSGSKTNGALTHNGVPVVVTLVNGEWVGKAGDLTVFKLEMNTSTGDYKFTLYDNLDHADKTNPDDQIVLDFGVAASDFDGDHADGSIRIIVKDDGPVANDDVNTYDTTFGVANGNVVTGLNGGPGAADVLSTDGWTASDNSNKVVKIAFGGNEIDVPEVGTVSIDGQYGTLTIASDGTYTYKAFDNGGMVDHGGQKEFVGGAALPDFDESEALDGVEQQSLGVAPGNLAVQAGDTVTVKYVGEVAGYSNTLGAFTIDANGKLVAETILVKNSDQATPGQPLSFTAGSDAKAVGFFLIADGANANNNFNGLNLNTGSLNFVYHYGQPDQRDAVVTDDGAGISLVFTSANHVNTVLSGPLYFTSDRGGVDNLNADDSVRVVSGIPNGDNETLRVGFEDLPGLGDKDFNDLIFDVQIKGKDCGCGDPDIQDQFVYTLKDGDGDIDKATLTLNGQDLTDDTPILVAPAAETVDETNLNNGILTESGNILVDFGHDGPGTLAGSGAFTSTGSKLNDALTHGGVPVVVSYDANTHTYTGKAGNLTVFTMLINNDGSYSFKQFDNLDHKDGNDANDVIDLNFGVVATDCDGDKATVNIVVHVKDDAPVANNDVNSYDTNLGTATGNVVSGLNGGAGAQDVLSTDANNTVTKVSFGGNSVDVPAVGTATIDGTYGKLTIKADGTYSYDTFDKGGSASAVEKHFTSGPALPDFDEGEALDGVEQQSLGIAPGNLAVGKGDVVTVSYVGEQAGYSNSLGVFTITADGTLKAETILIKSSDQAVAGQSFSYTAANDAVATGFFIIADGANQYPQFKDIDLTKGHLDFVYDYGQPGAREAKVSDDGSHVKLVFTDEHGAVTVINAPTYFTSDRGGVDNLNADDSVRVVSGIPGNDDTTLRVGFEDLPHLGDKDFNDIVFDVQITDKDCGCNSSPQTDVFEYTLKDGDNDTDKATLTLTGKDLIDSNPIFATPTTETVDETNLSNGTIIETGAFSVNFGSDGPGTVTGNGGFTSGGSQLNDKLTSGGVAVQVTQVGNMYFGKANGVNVFTLTLKDDGSYTFKQFEQLDHKDGTNPNDIITLNFGVTATDCDGDTATSTLTVNVKDDAPGAKDDSNSAGEGQTVMGNVKNNDVVGQDTPGTITKVEFGGQTYDLTTGPKVIVGQFGTLTINTTGAYSYTANSNNPNGKDQFLYTLKDGDNDTDKATLTIDVTCVDDKPTITSAVETIDETNLSGGIITETGSVTATYGSDGPGVIAGNGSFMSAGSKTNNQLSHNGVPVSVGYNAGTNTYTGTAGGTTVFTLVIAANGQYTFKLLEQLDHADGNDINDVISLQFGVKATDADGDAQNSTITVNVKDDAPVAHDDHNTSTTSPATGNVVSGLNGGPGAADQLSQDVTNKVVKISFGSTTVDVPSSGEATIEGANGTLKIKSDGSYTYTAHADGNSSGEEKTFVGGPTLPDFDESEALDGVEQQSLGIAKGNLSVGEGDVISVNFVGEQAGYSNTLGIFTVDASGKLKAETIVIPNSDSANNGTHTYTAGAGSVSTGFFIIADGASINHNYAGIDLAHGSLDFVYKYGTGSAREATINDGNGDVTLVFTAQNGTKTVIDGPMYFTSDRGDYASLNDGEVRVVSGLPDQHDNTVLRVGFEDLPCLGDKDYNDVIFDISITNADCGCDNSDVFTYTLQDGDTDTSTATLTLDCIAPVDDKPTITPATETIDETYLSGGTITEGGNVTATYGNDGPGVISANGAFTATGSKLNGQLTSHGVPVSVALNTVTNTYEGKAGGTTIFTLVVAANGSYTFKLFEQLDHNDGSNPNDSIALNFGVTATDNDGDKASATITVNVKDDAPIANDDGRTMVNGTATIGGNVTNNDQVGQDVEGKVTKISFNGTEKDVPASGTVSIAGQYGTLVIDHTGEYVYTAKPNAHGTDNFTYVLKDNDGDTDPACLSIEVKENPIVVCIFADDICIKEDTSGNVPVHAYITGGSGNETMTITMTNVPSDWTVTAPGWTKNGGIYTMTLPQGVLDWNGSVNFKPPANSDLDLNGILFKASVYDPDTNATTFATEDANIIVDAVIDPLKFNASLTTHEWAPGTNKIFVDSQSSDAQHSKLNISNILHQDNDGSESLKTITFTLQDKMDNTTYISVKNNDGTFTKVGTQGADGKDTTYAINLSGMTYAQAVDYITNKLYLTNTGHSGLNGEYNLGITLVSYEKNLGGIEKDYSDNQTSYTVCLPVEFCISPLVIDLDKDGVELLSKEHGVLFDMTNDGVKDQTGWAAKDDALLALDKNHDGLINDRSELFGNTADHANGFASLGAYDSNSDGKIDVSDAIFKDLTVWQDLNSDGISQANEMKSLSDVGIASINLNAADVEYDIAGNPITHESEVLYADGSSSAIVDAWFAYTDGTASGVDKGLTLRGTDGNDTLSGGSGNDDLFGGLGADTFLFQTITEGVDTLKDFNAGEGDKVDLSNVLTNFDPLTDAINDFVFATETADGKTILSVNADGTGEASAHQFAVIDSGNVNVTDLFNNGSIIV